MSEPQSITQQLQDKIQELESCLLSQHPSMPVLLKSIWTTVKQYPEQAILLSEEEISTVFKALEHLTNTSVAAAVPKPKTKAAKNMTLEDL